MKQIYNKITTFWNGLEKKNKTVVKGILLVVIFSIVLIGIRNSYANVEGAYLNDQTVSGLLFSDASLEYENGLTTYTVDVSNTLEEEYNLKNINIIFKDKNNKEIVTLIGYVGENLKVTDKKILEASVDKELKDIEAIQYIVNK